MSPTLYASFQMLHQTSHPPDPPLDVDPALRDGVRRRGIGPLRERIFEIPVLSLRSIAARDAVQYDRENNDADTALEGQPRRSVAATPLQPAYRAPSNPTRPAITTIESESMMTWLIPALIELSESGSSTLKSVCMNVDPEGVRGLHRLTRDLLNT